MDDSAVSTSRPATPALVHSPSTARSSFSLRETQAVRPQSMRQPSWGKRHASLDSPRERPTVVPPGDFSSSMPSSALNGPPAPDPPHIHTPPSSPSAYAYPFLPPYEPRGEDRPSVKVDIYPDKYLLTCRMPHFDHSSITVATRRGRLLVVAADRWDALEPAPLSLDPALIPSPPQPAHFERRITFGWDADMQRIRAEFDGVCLHVTVPRRMAQSLGLSPHPSRASAPGLMGSDLEMSKGRSESGPPPRTTCRRDVAWPLG